MSIEKIVDKLAGKSVLFVGKTKTMSREDIELFLEQSGAVRADDESDESIGMIVFGRLVNPVEEAMCDSMEKKGIPVVSIEELERYYAATIDRDALLGSLTLFRNKERIINLLNNRAIPDRLYCEILKLYDWEGKGPFETDENRDVAGSLVARYYPDINSNHNIQYSPLGPFLVAAQCDDEKLLEAMAMIPDYEISQRSVDVWMPRTLHESLLINPAIPESLLKKYAGSMIERERAFAAMHEKLPTELQHRLYDNGSELVLEALAKNPSLDPSLHERLLKSGIEAVRLSFLKSQPLSDRILDDIQEYDEDTLRAIGKNRHLSEENALKLIRSGKSSLLESLAENERVSPAVYEALYAKKEMAIYRKLATNEAVGEDILQKLLRIRDKEVYIGLAANPSMPQVHLKNFSKIRDRGIMAALASNPSTPIDILLGYQTDSELNTIVKRNEAFGAYIKHNIGM